MRWLHGITDLMDKFGWTLGVGDGQRGLACCDSWGRKESETTEQLTFAPALPYELTTPFLGYTQKEGKQELKQSCS